MAKKAVLGGMGMSLRDALQNSMSIFLNELYRLEDSQEGLRALLEKRKPQWKNRWHHGRGAPPRRALDGMYGRPAEYS